MKAPSVISSHPLRGGLTLVIAMVVCAVALSACGGGSTMTDAAFISQARHQAADHVHSEERLRRLEARLHHLRSSGNGTYYNAPVPEYKTPVPEYTPAPESSTGGSCGGELSVNAHTSCPFAEAVEQVYFEIVGSGPGTVVAYSPVTERSYTMTCTGSPHECTGGDDAVVYFP